MNINPLIKSDPPLCPICSSGSLAMLHFPEDCPKRQQPYTLVYTNAQPLSQPLLTEADVRRIAREEIERARGVHE